MLALETTVAQATSASSPSRVPRSRTPIDAASPGGVLLDDDLLHEDVTADVDAVGLHLRGHEVDHGVRAALEDEDALRHEVREDDAEGDRGVVKGGAVGVGDRLAQVREEGLDGLGGEPELLGQDPGEVRAVEGRPDVEVRVDEADVVELMDAVRDLLGPVTPGGLDHPVREAVQGVCRRRGRRRA